MVDGDGDELAFLASSVQDLNSLEYAETVDDLLSHCYEGEYFYLVATDAYGVPRFDPPAIELNDHSQIVFRHLVNAQWLEVAQKFEGFVWVTGFEWDDAIGQHLRDKSLAALYALFEEAEITLVMVSVPSDPSKIGEL
jgi:hypothetical protein